MIEALPTTEPGSWRRCQVAEKICRTSEWALAQLEIERQDKANLIEELHQLREKKSKPSTRTQIPVQGIVFTDKAEIKELFKKRIEQKEALKLAWKERLQKQITKLHDSINQTVRKKHKAEDLEARNCLPKRFKTFAQHSEAETKL